MTALDRLSDAASGRGVAGNSAATGGTTQGGDREHGGIATDGGDRGEPRTRRVSIRLPHETSGHPQELGGGGSSPRAKHPSQSRSVFDRASVGAEDDAVLGMATLAGAALERARDAFWQLQGQADRVASGNVLGIDDLPPLGRSVGGRQGDEEEGGAEGHHQHGHGHRPKEQGMLAVWARSPGPVAAGGSSVWASAASTPSPSPSPRTPRWSQAPGASPAMLQDSAVLLAMGLLSLVGAVHEGAGPALDSGSGASVAQQARELHRLGWSSSQWPWKTAGSSTGTGSDGGSDDSNATATGGSRDGAMGRVLRVLAEANSHLRSTGHASMPTGAIGSPNSMGGSRRQLLALKKKQASAVPHRSKSFRRLALGPEGGEHGDGSSSPKARAAAQLAPTPGHVALAVASWASGIGVLERGGVGPMTLSIGLRQFARAVTSAAVGDPEGAGQRAEDGNSKGDDVAGDVDVDDGRATPEAAQPGALRVAGADDRDLQLVSLVLGDDDEDAKEDAKEDQDKGQLDGSAAPGDAKGPDPIEGPAPIPSVPMPTENPEDDADRALYASALAARLQHTRAVRWDELWEAFRLDAAEGEEGGGGLSGAAKGPWDGGLHLGRHPKRTLSSS